jgi:hypothetical protein
MAVHVTWMRVVPSASLPLSCRVAARSVIAATTTSLTVIVIGVSVAPTPSLARTANE